MDATLDRTNATGEGLNAILDPMNATRDLIRPILPADFDQLVIRVSLRTPQL